jgi:hypothetical protein
MPNIHLTALMAVALLSPLASEAASGERIERQASSVSRGCRATGPASQLRVVRNGLVPAATIVCDRSSTGNLFKYAGASSHGEVNNGRRRCLFATIIVLILMEQAVSMA